MTRPGVDVNLVDTAPARGGGIDISALFAAGSTERGPTTPVQVNTFGDWVKWFGGRVAQGIAYDCIQAAFASKIGTLWFSRIVGPSSVVGGVQLLNSATVSVTANANGAGTWANVVGVTVAAGVLNTSARIITVDLVTDDAGTITETSPELATRADIVAWGAGTQLVRFTLGANTGLPDAHVRQLMTGGADDIANENDTAFQAAYDRLGSVDGTGQCIACGRTTSAAIATLANHAGANRRVALADLPDTPTTATLLAAAVTARGLVNARWLSLWAPWVTIPGLTSNTVRTIPFSSILAGLIATADRSVVPAQAVAGRQYGASIYALDVTQVYSDADRLALSNAGVNLARNIQGVVESYDYVSAADPNVLLAWRSFGSSRTAMLILAEADQLGDIYFGSLLDGKRKTLHAFGGAVEGILKALYDRDALYGETAADAYRVEVDSVNSPETIANLELHAAAAFRVSPFAEWVVLDISNIPITQGV